MILFMFFPTLKSLYYPPTKKATRHFRIRWLLDQGTFSDAWKTDQWNCSSSVEPVRALTLDEPPWITVVTSSK